MRIFRKVGKGEEREGTGERKNFNKLIYINLGREEREKRIRNKTSFLQLKP